jgi:serine/threonine protein kinase
LNFCHQRGILHRDIKLDNILLDANCEVPGGEVKLCDFGVSKALHRDARNPSGWESDLTEQCGTPAYIAPEVLEGRGCDGFKADIWSAGVVLYAMLLGTVPFKASNMSEL